MASFLNGLAAAGAGLADFAGKAGLEYQRSELAQQQLVLANQLAMTRDTANNAFTSGENTLNRAATEKNLATTEAGQNTRLGISEAGATARTESTNATSRANNADTNQTSLATTAMTTKAAGERTDAEIKGQADRLSTTLKAGNEVTIDAKTGLAILVNKADGSVKPLLDGNGDPLQLPDTEGTKALTTVINTTNEELRQVDQRRSTDVRAAQEDVAKATSRTDLFGPEKDAEINRARKALADVQKQYEISIGALQGRLSAATRRLLSVRPSLNGAGMTGDRPPLDTILTTPNAAPTNATNSGLLNGGGQ
jgi:hypothetical protein